MNSLRPDKLRQFTGTANWYRHPLNRDVFYTDGAKYVADAVEAHWLLNEIALAQTGLPAIKAEPFQLWKLAVGNNMGKLTCENDNGQVVFAKEISFTDFPEPGIRLYFTNGVILLPSEY